MVELQGISQYTVSIKESYLTMHTSGARASIRKPPRPYLLPASCMISPARKLRVAPSSQPHATWAQGGGRAFGVPQSIEFPCDGEVSFVRAVLAVQLIWRVPFPSSGQRAVGSARRPHGERRGEEKPFCRNPHGCPPSTLSNIYRDGWDGPSRLITISSGGL